MYIIPLYCKAAKVPYCKRNSDYCRMNRFQALAFKSFQIAFKITTVFLPQISDKWAINLFLKPMRSPYTKKGKKFISDSKELSIEVNGRTHIGYSLGEGPTIVCVHGWAGKTTQFAHIAYQLAEHGYRFVGYDSWAHGANEGSSASMFDFKDLLIEVLNTEKNVRCVIGHSLGAASVSLAAFEGIQIPRFVSLGAPVVGEDILDVFIKRINGTARHKQAMREECRRTFKREFDEVTMQNTFSSLKNVPVLGVHGTVDIDADVRHLDILRKIHPEMLTYKAQGLGHRRILKDKKVLSLILEFIKSD